MSQESTLKQHLKQLKYKQQDAAVRDVLPVLNSYKSLVVGREQSVLPLTSASKEYLTISGTVPVFYKGSTYNIPICMFLLETHPFNPPVVFVRPTPDMVIAESRHVDRQGRVYLPYLAEWKHPASDLSGLIQVMSIIFAENMPVYSRPGATPAPPVQPQASSMSYPWQNQPQPASQTPYPTPQNQSFYPATQQSSMYPLVNSQPSPSQPGHQSANNLPYPTGPTQSQPPQPVSSWPQLQTPATTNSISQDEIKASLIWAVEDKLRRKLREDFDQLSTELASLRQTNSELVSGRKQISNILQTIESEKRDVENRIQAIDERKKEVDAAVTRLRSVGMPSVDEIVTAPYPVYRQLLDAHAEDLAIDDVIYHLGEALGRNRLPVEIYLRKVRELSIRQFMMRAVVDKCRQVAGLPALSSPGNAH